MRKMRGLFEREGTEGECFFFCHAGSECNEINEDLDLPQQKPCDIIFEYFMEISNGKLVCD